MTCHEVTEALTEANALPPADRAEVERHQQGCPNCRALLLLLSESPSPTSLDSGQLRRLQASVLADLTPVRPLRAARDFCFAFMAVSIAVAAIGVYRLDPYGWDLLTATQKAAVFTSLGASAALLSFSLVRQMVPGSRHRLPPALLPAGVIVTLFLVLAAAFQAAPEPGFVTDGIVCLKIGVSYAIPAAFLSWLLVRRGAVLSPRITAAAAGSFAGLTGMTVLEVHCANFDLLHIIAWHLGVVVMGVALGVLFGAPGEMLRRFRGLHNAK